MKIRTKILVGAIALTIVPLVTISGAYTWFASDAAKAMVSDQASQKLNSILQK